MSSCRATNAKGRGADHENSRADAIWLFCVECMGGSRSEAAACGSAQCFLYPFRPGADGTRPVGAVPTPEDYDAMGPSEERRAEMAERLATARAAKGGES